MTSHFAFFTVLKNQTMVLWLDWWTFLNLNLWLGLFLLSASLRNFFLRQDRLSSGAALLISSRAGYDLGFASRLVWGFVNCVPLPRFLGLAVDRDGVTAYINMPRAGFQPPAQSHASYEVSALPPSHHGRFCGLVYSVINWKFLLSPHHHHCHQRHHFVVVLKIWRISCILELAN